MLQTPFSIAFYEAEKNLAATLLTGITFGARRRQQTPGKDRRGDRDDSGSEDADLAGDAQPDGEGTATAGCHRDSTSGFSPCTPGVPDTIVDGPEEMRQKVRELIRMGADVIKVATSGGVLSPATIPATPIS